MSRRAEMLRLEFGGVVTRLIKIISHRASSSVPRALVIKRPELHNHNHLIAPNIRWPCCERQTSFASSKLISRAYVTVTKRSSFASFYFNSRQSHCGWKFNLLMRSCSLPWKSMLDEEQSSSLIPWWELTNLCWCEQLNEHQNHIRKVFAIKSLIKWFLALELLWI